MKRTLLALASVSALAFGVAGCSSASDSGSSDDASADPSSRMVSAADLSGSWPLTVGSGTLRCDGSGGTGEVTFEGDGKVYAVNGLAKQSGLPEIDAIWKDDPDAPGLKLDIGELLQAGLDLCE